ncbi:hypothetical protein [Roseibium sp. MMSF_3544]|uniref:hypothetical protein n=1 Tax=unclassified Roseibium TaxID=2629323 RepID=UPI00273D64BD|nr:hypothetical protein [Roseibium sp. MMSF_3544]
MTNSVLDPDTGTSAGGNPPRTDIDVDNTEIEQAVLRLDTPFDGNFPGDVRVGFGTASNVSAEFSDLIGGNNVEARNKGSFNDVEKLFIEAFEGDGIDGVEIRIRDNRTVEFVLQSTTDGAKPDSFIVTGEFVESYFESLYGPNYIIDHNSNTIIDGEKYTASITDDVADTTTLVFNDEYGSRITDSVKFGFGGKFGELGKALKGSNLDFRAGKSNGDDLERLLKEAIEPDGMSLGGTNKIVATVVDAQTVKLTTYVDGAMPDEIILTGDYIDGFLKANFNNFAVGNDGFADNDLTREDFDVDNGVQENVTIIVNNEFGTSHPNTVESNFGIHLRDALKGTELDLRTGRSDGDDLDNFLADAFDFNKDDGEIGINGINAEVLNDFTVQFTFNFESDDANNDILTISGEWVEGWLDENGLDSFDFVNGGLDIGSSETIA